MFSVSGLLCILSLGLSLNLEHPGSARLTDQLLLYLLYQHWGYKHAPLSLLFNLGSVDMILNHHACAESIFVT